MIILDHNGFVSGTSRDGLATVEEIKNCPWFWSKKLHTWVHRPEFLTRPNDEVQEMIKSDPAYRDDD
jgi:hypothetical protein